uniref:Uncharacterized protein n=1 Tax=Cannabis sativa TaxID=3483 RepID=A0A803PZG8_CANSA
MAELLVASQEEDALIRIDIIFEVQKAVPVRRRYKTCTIFLKTPLGSFDEVKRPLNALGHPSVVRIDHVLDESTGPQILERREQPRGQGSARPGSPLPASRDKGKVAVSDSSLVDSSSKDDYPLDDMASRMRDLAGRLFGSTSSGHPQAKVAQTARSFNANQSTLPPPPPGPVFVDHLVIMDPPPRSIPPPRRPSSKGAMLKLSLTHARTKESAGVPQKKLEAKEAELKVTRLIAETYRMQKELEKEHREKKLALDGQQSIKNEYIGLSSEVLYEVYLHNPNVDLGYIGCPFYESSLLRGMTSIRVGWWKIKPARGQTKWLALLRKHCLANLKRLWPAHLWRQWSASLLRLWPANLLESRF